MPVYAFQLEMELSTLEMRVFRFVRFVCAAERTGTDRQRSAKSNRAYGARRAERDEKALRGTVSKNNG